VDPLSSSPKPPEAHVRRREAPIGIFDSGIGGLTVAGAVRRLLPEESVLYVGDLARLPYGGRSPETVQRYSFEISEHLLERGAKAIVVACNTASAVAVALLQLRLPVPVLGVIGPGAAAAVASTRRGRVGVIGTRATITSGAYEKAIHQLNPAIEVQSVACPLLVPFIEEGLLDDPLTEQVLRRYLDPMLAFGMDTLVLGCTHYPLLKPLIRRVLGPEITLVDSAQNCALALRDLLANEGLAAEHGTSDFHVALTDRPAHFLAIAEQALELEIASVEAVTIPFVAALHPGV